MLWNWSRLKRWELKGTGVEEGERVIQCDLQPHPSQKRKQDENPKRRAQTSSVINKKKEPSFSYPDTLQLQWGDMQNDL